MRSHTLDVLGLELSFKAAATPGRIERAKTLLDERYDKLAQQHGGLLSKEKLLTFLALSLADDILLMREKEGEANKRIEELLGDIEKAAG